MEDLGSHCQHDGCNQLDFLPFKCPSCKKSLCLTHRSFAMHGCSSGAMGGKDVTSLDCPICGQSGKCVCVCMPVCMYLCVSLSLTH